MNKFRMLACENVPFLEDRVDLVGQTEDLPSQIAASSEEFPDGAGSEILLNRLSFPPLSGEVSIRESSLERRQWCGEVAEGTFTTAHIDPLYDMRVSKVVMILIWRTMPLSAMRVYT